MSTRNHSSTGAALAAVAAMSIFAAPAYAAPGSTTQPIARWTVDYAHATADVTDIDVANGLRAAGFTQPQVVARLTAITWRSAERLSGGSPNAFAPEDGTYGLMQLTPDVFATHHARGTSSRVYDPVANVAAAWNYLVREHGVQPGTGNGAEKMLALAGVKKGDVTSRLSEPGPAVRAGSAVVITEDN